MNHYDAIIIGGGFYGCSIAIYLVKQRGFKKVLLIEREAQLLTRASYNNQARVHNGYHYPRSFTTAYRSRVNLPKFITDYPKAIKKDFTQLYAIARHNSKVTAKQFERFCHSIDAKLQVANSALYHLFEPRLIEAVFLVEEYAFDSSKLADYVKIELQETKVECLFNSQVTAISKADNNKLMTEFQNKQSISSDYVFNCSYSGLNQFSGDFSQTKTPLKQEMTEMALLKLPPVLENLGITVMDGAFFSLMPFPAKQLHSLSHVRYTPHLHWQDTKAINPYEKLADYSRDSRVDRMLRDVARYLPSITLANYVESLFEIKTVLLKNEADDGRPILFEKHSNLAQCYSILGGKIDNIYDVLEKLDAEQLIINRY